MKTLSVACTAFLLLSPVLRAAANDAQTVTLDKTTEIPGTTLQPGSVKLEVEDRLQDRAIVRITEADGTRHDLVLSVPNDKLTSAGAGELVFFPTTDGNKQTVQAWKCQSCSEPLEFVYPKDQAVAVTQNTGKPVMAVDPSYDKLPKNLSQDDMKVVTLWLLAPKKITADGKGSGVEPTKLADLKSQTTAVAASSAPAAPAAPAVAAYRPAAPEQPAAPVTVAAAEPPAEPKMPHTAGNTSEYALAGILLLGASGLLTARRRLQSAAAEGNR